MQQYDALIAQLREEFLDEAEENLSQIELTLQRVRNKQTESKEALTTIRRTAHTLKGSAGIADMPTVGIIMHRLEDYLAGNDTIDNEAMMRDVELYVDYARAVVKGKKEITELTEAALVRQLPTKREAEKTEAPEATIETLLVMKEHGASQLFARELRQFGLHVSCVAQSFKAIELAVRTQPSLILVSGVLDELSGIDVIAALRAMPTTAKIPVALLTSYDKDHPELQKLPQGTHLIRKKAIKEDVPALLKNCGLS